MARYLVYRCTKHCWEREIEADSAPHALAMTREEDVTIHPSWAETDGEVLNEETKLKRCTQCDER